MKRLMLLACLAAAASAGANEPPIRRPLHAVTTPVGLSIRAVGVHDFKPDPDDDYRLPNGRFYGIRFYHGNATLRLQVDNPTTFPQPLAVEVPVTVGSAFKPFEPVVSTRLSAARTVPPGSNRTVEFTLPHVGQMRGIGLAANWRFTDASGRSVDGRDLIGFDPFEFCMPLPAANDAAPALRDNTTVAVSPSFRGLSGLDALFAAERSKSKSRLSRYFTINRPDFSRFTDWRDLACYSGLVFETNDWVSASAEFRELAKDYLAAGGRIFFAATPREIDPAKFVAETDAAKRALSGYAADSTYESDVKSRTYVRELKNATPFGSIVLVLLAFAIVAGPVTVFVLAKRGRRIHILWVFPSVAIAFSVAVALTIVFANGLSVKVTEFSCVAEHPELGRRVVVNNLVYVAPFPMREPIRCPANALVTVDSGADDTAGERIFSTPDGILFAGNWTPCLWPVRVRTVEVVRTGVRPDGGTEGAK